MRGSKPTPTANSRRLRMSCARPCKRGKERDHRWQATNPRSTCSCSHRLSRARSESAWQTASPARMVATRSSLHPFSRRDVARRHRQRLLRRVSVPTLHLAVCWRSGPSLKRHTTRADLAGLAGLETRRRLMAGVGHRRTLWLDVTRSQIIQHLARRLSMGSLIHWPNRCPTCDAFWCKPFEEQRRLIAEAGNELRERRS